MDPSRFYTTSLRDARLARILAAALEAVDPARAVQAYLREHPLPQGGGIYALALGKAALAMLEGLCRFVSPERALVITKHAPQAMPEDLRGVLPEGALLEGGHPIPDARSLAAGEAALRFVSGLGREDLLACLISGGGSALMSASRVPLEHLQALTAALLASGATIEQINTLRRHLDRVKGGGLAVATRARVLSLVLSDVVGSPLEAIASGPTTPDPTTRGEALEVLDKYFRVSSPSGDDVRGAAARRRGNLNVDDNERSLRSTRQDMQDLSSILDALASAPETPKPGDARFKRVKNVIVGDNPLAVQAAVEQAGREGFRTESLGSAWQGEAREVGKSLAERLRVATKESEGPTCLVAGGETTVTLRGEGRGGRNQELALAAVAPLAGLEGVLLVSLASDGEDGPTDAAGAVVTGETLARARSLGMDPAETLARNDAYAFFERLGDLLRTGPTGTNVNDLTFLFTGLS